MVAVDELVIKWSMDSKNFNDGLTAMNRNMNVLKSGFNATATKLKSFGNSTDQLKNKQEYLTKAMEIQKSKIDTLKSAYDKQVEVTGKNSKEAQNLAVKLNNQIGYYNKLEAELKQTNSELEIQSSKWNKVSKNLDAASSKLKSFGSKMSSVGRTMTLGVTTPIVAAGAASFNFASDMEESLNKVEVACGSGANEVKKFSETTLERFGIAKGTTLDMASTFADMGNGMGLNTKQANDMSMSLVGLAGDLSSFKNVRVDIAKTALNGIYTGETESLKSLGIVMTQANLQEYAYSQGINKKIQDMSQAEQVQLRYNYVMEKTKNAQGDFARTSDGAANQQRIFTESLKELGATFGQNLLPIVTPFISKLNDMLKTFGGLDKSTQQSIIKFGVFAAVLGPVLTIGGKVASGIGVIAKVFSTVSGAIGVVKTGATAATPAIGALAKVFTVLTGPVGIVIGVIAGLVVVGVLLYKNWDKIKEKASQLGAWIGEKWNNIKQKTSETWGNMKEKTSATWNAMQNKIQEHGGGIKGVVGLVGEGMKKSWSMAFDNMDSATGGKLSAIKSKVEQHGGGIKGVLGLVGEGMKKSWSMAFDNMDNATNGKLSGMANKVRDGLGNIRNFFANLSLPEIKIPHIKMPHFNISGEFSLKPPSIPKIGVDWYHTGAIFTRPTVLGGIGVGDAYKGTGSNAEAIIPLDSMYKNIRSIVREEQTTQPIYVLVNVANNMDHKAIGKVVTTEVKKEITRETNNYKKSKGGLSFAK